MEALQRQEEARKFRALLERGESVIKDREQCEDGAKLKEVWRELSKSTAESNPEHGDAKKLAKKLERCRKRAVKKAQKGACELLGGLREEYVERLDRIFLDQGMDVRLKLRGECKTSLTLDYVLWNRATVHQFVQAGDFLSSTEKLGFKKLVFSSFDETYTYTLTPKNMLDDILLNQGIFYAFELK